MLQTYTPSGRVGPMTVPLAIVGLIVSLAAVYVYQLGLYWIPLIYVNFLLTLGLGFVIGVTSAFVVKQGKVRNMLIAGLLGVVLSTVGLASKYYFQHQTLISDETKYIMDEKGIPADQKSAVRKVVAEEITFWKHIEFRVEQGWEIGRGGGGGAPISGIFVYLIWLLEAGIVYFTAVAIARSAASEPYSEKVDAWATEEEVVMTLPITNPSMVAAIQKATSVDDLLNIPIPKTDESNQFAIYQVNSIEGQEMEDAYLSVELLTFSINKKGEEEQNKTPLVKHAILTSEQRHQLAENASLLQEALDDYRESLEEEVSDETDAGSITEAEPGVDELPPQENA